MKDFHQACTRMIRADYQGDGKSFTREGTEIFVVDVLGINKGTPPKGMRFEAAWSVDGALAIAKPRVKNRRSLATFGFSPAKGLFQNRGTAMQEALIINYSYDK